MKKIALIFALAMVSSWSYAVWQSDEPSSENTDWNKLNKEEQAAAEASWVGR